jgi:hypothetical protein
MRWLWQIAALSDAERAALRRILAAGRMTDAQLADFCCANRLAPITGDALTRKVTFLTRDHVTGAWFVAAEIAHAVAQVVAEPM